MGSRDDYRLVLVMPFYGKPYLGQRDDPIREVIWDITRKRVRAFSLREEEENVRKVEERVIKPLIEDAKKRSIKNLDALLIMRLEPTQLSNLVSMIIRIHTRLFQKRLSGLVSAIDPQILLPNHQHQILVSLEEVESVYGFVCEKCIPTMHIFGGHLCIPRGDKSVLLPWVHGMHKGDAVRLAIEEALLKPESMPEKANNLEKTLVLHVDGMGIPLHFAFQAVQRFIECLEHGKELHALLGLRPCSGYWGISCYRKIVEIWENYLVSRRLGLKYLLPDAQCGLWCLRGDVALDIIKDLEAHRFELELDILLELLLKERIFDYVPIWLEDEGSERKPRAWEEEFYAWACIHADKLSLIVRKLGLNVEILDELFMDFREWFIDHKNAFGVFLSPEEVESFLDTYGRWVLQIIKMGLQASGPCSPRKLPSDEYKEKVNRVLEETWKRWTGFYVLQRKD